MRNKIISTLKSSAYILIPIVMLLSAGLIARTQEEPTQSYNLPADEEQGQEQSSVVEAERVIPEWVKPARWFRSNSGGMPLEEVKSKAAAMHSEYALVIDYAGPYDLPDHLLDYYDNSFFIETRTLYKVGRHDRTQWIFRDENYGVRLIAVLFEAVINAAPVEAAQVEAEQVADNDNTPPAEEPAAVGMVNAVEAVEIAAVQNDADNPETENKPANTGRRGPARGFIEIYDEEYHLATEYNFFEKGDNTKVDYFYNNNMRVSANAMLWDDKEADYIQAYTDYYRYNRSAFLRSVERVFLTDQKLTAADNVVKVNNGAEEAVEPANNVVKVSFPVNVIAAARNVLFMGERINAYPEFFGDLFALKDSKLVFTTDDHGRVLEQTLINNDEKQTVIWKIVNTWSNDRIAKITKTEGDTVLTAEYEYARNGDRILERNIKDGVLERVVRTDGKTDIEELYLDNKLVLRAVWEDGRKVSETRIKRN